MESILALFHSLLKESAQTNLQEFPRQNFCVSFFTEDKHLEVSPIDETKDIDGIRPLIKMLKDEFEVYKVVQLEDNTFSVKFAPQQDFTKVISFIQQQPDK